MDKIVLRAQPRPEVTPAKIRRQNLIPAIVYGHNVPTENLAISYSEFEKAFRKAGESTIIELDANGQVRNVIVQAVQRHYLNNRFLHIDFYVVRMDEKLKATVPLVTVGSSPAVKEGNVLVNVLTEVEIECLPADLPHSIEVDISSLVKVNDAVHVGDLNVGSKVQILTDAEEVVAKINAPRDVEAELAEPIVEDVSKVEGAAEEKAEGTDETSEKTEKSE